MSRNSRTLLPALLLAAPLLACISEPAGDIQRALSITDSWELQEAVVLDAFETCAAYWSERCAGLHAATCSFAKTRNSCTQNSKGGVTIRDTYSSQHEPGAWLALHHGGQVETETPDQACESMPELEHEHCLELAAFIAAQSPDLLAQLPHGGFARPYIIIEDELMLHAPNQLDARGNLLLTAASELAWSAPVFAESINYAYDTSFYVYEDDIILMVAPNGTIALGTEALVFAQR